MTDFASGRSGLLRHKAAGVAVVMLLMLCGLLVSCGGLESSAHRLEKQIARQTAVAVEITEGVVSLLGSSSVDSLLSFTTNRRNWLRVPWFSGQPSYLHVLRW